MLTDEESKNVFSQMTKVEKKTEIAKFMLDKQMEYTEMKNKIKMEWHFAMSEFKEQERVEISKIRTEINKTNITFRRRLRVIDKELVNLEEAVVKIVGKHKYFRIRKKYHAALKKRNNELKKQEMAVAEEKKQKEKENEVEEETKPSLEQPEQKVEQAKQTEPAEKPEQTKQTEKVEPKDLYSNTSQQ